MNEDKILLVKRYGIIGAFALVFPFVEPFITEYFSDVTTKKFSQIVKEQIYECASKENKVSSETMLRIARIAVAKQSIHKVDEIRNILNSYDTVLGNENRIKLSIKNELYKQSDIYIKFLNTFAPHPKIGYVGDYIVMHFDMDTFLDNVNRLALNINCGDVNNKANDIMMYMLDIQNVFFKKMEEDMKYD